MSQGAVASADWVRSAKNRAWRPYVTWLFVIAAGVALLYGRFDWSVGDGHYADRAFVLSAYLFALVLPTTYYLARRVLRSDEAALVITAALFVVATVPWKLLGLDQVGYYRDRPRTFGLDQVPNPPALEFFPGGALRTFPYDSIFMPLLFATGVAAIWLVWWLRARGGASAARLAPLLLTAAFAAICVQAYLHTSMRAPYTYLSYFQLPEAQQHWYHVYHFRDGTGATEGDQWVFTPLEEYFQATPRDGNNMLVRRPFSYYAVSQFSFFINSFYIWLGLNCLFWLAAIAATGRWVARVTTDRVGLIAAAFVTVGPGFVAFAGTTGMYMQAFAAAAIAICLFEELVVRSSGRRWGELALYAGVLAICTLVYDLLPIIVSLFVYGLARRVRVLPMTASLLAALLVARGFTFLVTGVLGLDLDKTNSAQLTTGLNAVKDLVLHPTLYAWYTWTVDLLSTFVHQLLAAFFVIPLLLAIAGLPRLKDRALQLFAASMLVTGFATVAVLQIGHILVGEAPRLLYPLFPVVYLLAALALDAVRLPGRRLRNAAPWIAVAAVAVLVNVDIFGYPTFFVEFFVNLPPVFLPN